MSSNRKILVRTFLKEHNKFLNLENLTRQVNPGTIVKYYSRTAIVDIVDQNFLQKLAITPTPPQLTLFNHDYNVGKVNILENVIGTNHIHAEFSLKSSNSFFDISDSLGIGSIDLTLADSQGASGLGSGVSQGFLALATLGGGFSFTWEPPGSLGPAVWFLSAHESTLTLPGSGFKSEISTA